MADRLASIGLPSTWAVLEGMFREAGYECAPSSKGQLAVGVLNLLGALDDLPLITSSKVYKMLSSLAKTQGRQWFQAALKELIPRATPQELEDVLAKLTEGALLLPETRPLISFSEISTKLGGSRVAKPVLTRLLERGVLFRGVEVTCPECTFRTWYGVDKVGTEFSCEGCQKVSRTPLEPAATSWRYRLNELYARAFDQGVLVHLLVAYHRAAERFLPDPLFGLYPGVDLRQQGAETSREVDYAEIANAKLVIGECKAKASRFDNDEAAKLSSLATQLDCEQVVVATASGTVAPEILDLMNRSLRAEVRSYGETDLFDKEPWSDAPLSPDEYLEKVVKRLISSDSWPP